jgi:HD superfamily phosphohydrolase
MLHDVGHGPFSHLFEPCLGIDHEVWSKNIILDPSTTVHSILRGIDKYLPQKVADLIDKDNYEHPAWQKALLSSQLDMDRLDYLRRDSLFTGAGYGHFDFHRILNTFELHDGKGGNDLVWVEKSKFAIEEYIFARYYMYQNVYLHHTTRGFEKMLEAMWRRAQKLHDDGRDVKWNSVLGDFLAAGTSASVQQYLKIEEFTVLHQIQAWIDHPDPPLKDLAQRFLNRHRFVPIAPPQPDNDLAPSYE